MTDPLKLADELARLADAIDPRKEFRAYNVPHADLIAASDALRARTPGYAAGVEDSAQIADGWLQRFRDSKIDYVRADKYASDAVADIRDAIRTLSPAAGDESVGTDRLRFEAWLQTDGGKRAVAQILARVSELPVETRSDLVTLIRSSLWWAFVHGWHARERE